MNTIINLILIQIIVVFIIDLSGVIDSIKHFLWKRYVKKGDYRNLNLKPFSCSLCSTWWIGLLYLLLTKNLTIPFIAVVALLSLLAANMADLERFLMDAFTHVINKLYKLLK